MGFRDMEGFNFALLTRQGWRIMQDPDSLLSRMLKARYFPRTSFMEAKGGYQPSYAWRSLLKGRETLSLGLRWHVGNGAKIRAFVDNWIPRPPSFRTIANFYGFENSLTVADVIDWNNNGWDVDIVQEIFHPLDAEIILQMRIRGPTMEDELIWHHTKNVLFSVKTAYHCWMENKYEAHAEASNSLGKKQLWRKVWHLPVQPRIRTFLWRACRRLLLSKANLFFRKITEHNICEFCTNVEDEAHVLFHCREARCVWCLVPELKGALVYAFDVLNTFDYAQENLTRDQVQLWLT